MATTPLASSATGCAALPADAWRDAVGALARTAEAATAWRPAGASTAGLWRTRLRGGRLAGQQTFPLGALARKFARASHGLGLLAHPFLGWLLVVVPQLHLAENTLALHFLLQRLEGLINIVVANLNQQAVRSSLSLGACRSARQTSEQNGLLLKLAPMLARLLAKWRQSVHRRRLLYSAQARAWLGALTRSAACVGKIVASNRRDALADRRWTWAAPQPSGHAPCS